MQIDVAAKLNINLKIAGRSGKLHVLRSVMQSIDLFDTLYIEPSKTDIIEMSQNVENNTVAKAIKIFREFYTCGCVKVKVEKRIPIGAGLGGSSADAAATLVGLAAISGIPLKRVIDDKLASRVGSDVTFMLTGGCATVGGIGDEITPIKSDKRFFVVIVPQGSVSTTEAYALFDKIGGEQNAVNDLEKAAKKLNADIDRFEKCLKEIGVEEVFMSGSGSAVVGVCKSLDEAAKTAAKCNGLNARYIGVHSAVNEGVKIGK